VISAKGLANLFDHTLLKVYAAEQDFEVLCREADQNDFNTVAINSTQTAHYRRLLKYSAVHVATVIGFPLGQTVVESNMSRLLFSFI